MHESSAFGQIWVEGVGFSVFPAKVVEFVPETTFERVRGLNPFLRRVVLEAGLGSELFW